MIHVKVGKTTRINGTTPSLMGFNEPDGAVRAMDKKNFLKFWNQNKLIS